VDTLLILKIAGGLVAFAFGIWAGLGSYKRDPEELEKALTEKGFRRKATRYFTPMDMVSRMTGVSTRRDRGNPFHFDEEEEEGPAA